MPNLSLSLLVLGIFANNTHPFLAPDDLTFTTHFFYGSANFHIFNNLITVNNPSLTKIVRRNLNLDSITGQKHDVIHAHSAGEVS